MDRAGEVRRSIGIVANYFFSEFDGHCMFIGLEV